MEPAMDQLSPESLLQIERDLALALSAASDLPTTLRCVLHAARQVAGIDCGGVYLVDERTGDLDLVYTEELPPEFVASAAHFAADAPQTHLVMAGRALYAHLAALSPLMDDVRRKEGLRAIVILPIAYEGRVIAGLNLGSHRVDEIPAAGRAALEFIAAQLGAVVSRISAETALRESQQNLQTLFDSVDELILVLDETGRVCHFNPTVPRRLGYSPDEIRGVRVDDIHPQQSRQELAAAIAGLAAGQPLLITTPLKAKDGTLIPMECRLSRGNWDGRPAFFIVAYDASERKRAEEERLEMERRLWHAQKLESLGVLAGGIAHDFNTLLGAILGNLDLALFDTPAHSPARESLREAIGATVRAAELTRELLAYSGRGNYVIEAVDLSDLVHEMARLLKVGISKSVTLRLSLERALPHIQADPTQLRQVVMNLITNASDAIGDRAGVISVTTGWRDVDETWLLQSRLESRPPAGRFVFLEVADTGCGMDLETVQRLFDPFFTTKRNGRGLGMSSVLGIIRGHQGAILVDSEMEVGTKITVLFPMAEAGQAEVPGSLSRHVRREDEDSKRREGVILVVDDDEAMRRLGACMLERLGFRALTAADGEEAVAVFRQRAEEILCVLLDLTMPQLGGTEALDQLRGIRPDVKVVLMSGHTRADVLPRIAVKDLAGYIQKPYQMAELRAEVERVLGVQSQSHS